MGALRQGFAGVGASAGRAKTCAKRSGRRAGLAAVLVLATIARTPAQPVAQTDQRPAQYDVAVSYDVKVPMRDAVRLATDIYRPAKDGQLVTEPLPVLLERTPYGKASGEQRARYLSSHGYVVAVQDVRGRYASEGSFYIYINEPNDGYDTVEWLAKQPWSSGDVGTYGGSYGAATQNAAATLHPPHLKTMLIFVGTSNYWEDGAGTGGAFALLHNVAYALLLASTSSEALASPELRQALTQSMQPDRLASWCRAYPFRPNASPVQSLPDYQSWMADFVQHYRYDDYWKQAGFSYESHYAAYPDIPVELVGGWYDVFLPGTLRNYRGIAARHKSPTRLVIGPWVHQVGTTASGEVDFGPTAALDIRGTLLRWFDQVLKRRDTGVLQGPPVQVFVMGGGDGSKTVDGHLKEGGTWAAFADWPMPEAHDTPYYLYGDGTLAPRAPQQTVAKSTYTFDPDHPVPTIGGKIDSGKELAGQGPRDQRCDGAKIDGCENDLPLSARRDVLVFQTPPLDEDVVVTGPVSVKLWASTSAKDTDFTAKLLDVHPSSTAYPGGFSMLVADSIVRGRFRNGTDHEQPMQPAVAYPITIDLIGTAIRFKKGDRIRLDISSSNFPLFDVNPNTGERPGWETHREKALNTVYHDRAHPSHIVLPILTQGVRSGL
jgi:uncharacterized protein